MSPNRRQISMEYLVRAGGRGGVSMTGVTGSPSSHAAICWPPHRSEGRSGESKEVLDMLGMPGGSNRNIGRMLRLGGSNLRGKRRKGGLDTSLTECGG